MVFKPFEAGNIIMLKKGMSSFPLTDRLPDLLVKHNVIPMYLGPHSNGFIKEGEILLVSEVFYNKENRPYAYSCLFKERIVYLVSMLSEGIDPTICFIKCN